MPSKNLAIWLDKHGSADAIFGGSAAIDPDNRWAPFRALKTAVEAAGGWCHTQDVCQRQGLAPDAVLFLDIPAAPAAGLLAAWGGAKKFALLQECVVMAPRNWDSRLHAQFDALFTWSPALVDGRRYFRVNFSNAFPAGPAPAPQARKFCALIAGNKKNSHPLELYSEREKTIRWFEKRHPEEFDLYGMGWDRYAFGGPRALRALNRLTPLTRLIGGRFPSYRGTVEYKRPVLGGYKFSICYENAREIPGYVTEKIFDCLFAGCVPVYWGAPDIEKYVPKECFIDRRDFATHEELYAFLKAMTVEEYAARTAAIAQYLAGNQWYMFSDKYFGETITAQLNA